MEDQAIRLAMAHKQELANNGWEEPKHLARPKLEVQAPCRLRVRQASRLKTTPAQCLINRGVSN